MTLANIPNCKLDLNSGSFLIKSLILNILSPNSTYFAPLYYENICVKISIKSDHKQKSLNSTNSIVLELVFRLADGEVCGFVLKFNISKSDYLQ